MNFLFWNIKKKTSDDFMMHVVNLLNENSIDIFMVAELPQDNIQYFERYIIDKTDGKYKLINGFLFKKVIIFATQETDIALFDATDTGKRIAAFTIRSRILDKKILLFPIHFYDKFNIDSDEQNERIVKIRDYIERIENLNEEKDLSIVCGDFNLNPHETPMIKASGMHAVMDRRIALKGKRKVQGEDFSYFYNPMWGLWGDTGKGDAPGSFYLCNSGCYISMFWHLLDQVIMRKGLIDYFEFDRLNIISEINGDSMLKEDGSINGDRFSDHLPLTFSVNI